MLAVMPTIDADGTADGADAFVKIWVLVMAVVAHDPN